MRTAILVSSLVIAMNAHAAPLALDPSHSDLVVTVRKKGLFSALEHDHFLHPQRWSGTLTFDAAHPEEARLELTVDAHSLADHQPKLSESDRAKVEGQIRSPMVLDADHWPEVRFVADHATLTESGDELRGELHGTLALHGETRAVTIPFAAHLHDGAVRATGHVEINQSDFGIKPMKKAGGALGVQDRVSIDFDARFAPE